MRIGTRELRSLFLVGGPRCGTTSLAHALKSHPQVCFSRPKETYYMMRAPQGVSGEALREDFLRRYYPRIGPEHRVLIEGTPHTLYDDAALEVVLSLDPEARFLVSVRNPVDVVLSHHRRVLYTLDEDQQDFAAAWALCEARRRGARIPRRCRDPQVILYDEIGSFGARLEALFGRVGRERVHVVVQDDFRERGAEVVRGVLAFVGADTTLEIPLVQKRENVVHRFGWLQPYVMNPPRPIAALVERWDRQGKGRLGYLRPLRKRLKRWNTRHVEREPLDPALRSEIADFFAPDVEKLGKLLDRDLGHWR